MEAAIETFRGLLLGLFFLGVDMTLDLQVMARNWTLITSGVLSLMAVKASPSGESNSWLPSRRSHRPGVAVVRVSVHFRTRLYSEFRNNVSTQLLNDFLSRALSVFEIQDNVVHPDLLKRLQQKPQMVASQFEP